MSAWNDERLADQLEDLLEDDATPLTPDAPEWPRLEALRSVLPESGEVVLLPITPPADLFARIISRLETEGLVRSELTDEVLADSLEDLLSAEETRTVRETTARTPADRARLAALSGLLDEPVQLTDIEPPADLLSRVLSAQEQAGLVFDDAALANAEPAEVPAGLLDATLGRLESEGLMQPAAQPVASHAASGGEIIPFPRRSWGPAALAAVVLLGAALGLLLGTRLTTTDSDRIAQLEARLEEAASDTQEERLAREGAEQRERTVRERERLTLAELRGENRDLLAARTEDHGRAERLAGELSSERQLAVVLRKDRDRLQGLVPGLEQRLQERERELALLKKDPPPRDTGARTELARLRRTLRNRDALVAQLRETERAQRQRIAHLERSQPGGSQPETLAMVIDDARGVDWQDSSGTWKPVRKGDRLEVGTRIRGRSVASSIVTGDRPFGLRNNVFEVVSPKDIRWHSSAHAQPASYKRSRTTHTVAGWIRKHANDSTREQAQQALLALWDKWHDQDPGEDGVVFNVTSALVSHGQVREEVGSGPPTTARGWQRWWTRMRPIIVASR